MNVNNLIKKIGKLKRKRIAKNLSVIQSVVILYESTQSVQEINEIRAFGNEFILRGKEVQFIIYYPNKKVPELNNTMPDTLSICKSDFNFLGYPSSNGIKKIISTEYDLLINACLTDSKPLHTIAAFSKSHFRIGVYPNAKFEAFYELLVAPNGADLIENYLIEIGKNLKKIH